MKKLLIIFALFFITGCYDYRELNTLSIVSAISIDYNNDMYYISAEVINPQAADKTTIVQAPFIIYEGTGKTIQEAYRSIAEKTSRSLYSSHLEVLLLSENIEGDIFREVLDFYSRNPSIRTEFYVLSYTGDKPLELITPINKISSSSIINTIDTNSKYLGTTFVLSFNDLLNNYLNKNLNIIIPSIKIINNNNDKDKVDNTDKSNIETLYDISNAIVYDKDYNIQGYINDTEVITYNYIKEDIDNTIITYPCGYNKYLTLEVIKNKTNIKYKDNVFYIEFNINGNINEYQCEYNLNNKSNLLEIENNIEEYFNRYIEDNISSINNKYSTDIYGFMDYIYKNNYKEFNSIKNNNIKDFEYKINTNINILSLGNVKGDINEKD